MIMLQDPQYKTADGAALRIWRDAAQNRFLTEKLGRPIFDEVILCEVIAPGSGNSTPVFELERKFDENMAYTNSEGQNSLRGPKYQELKQFIDDFERNENGTGGSLAGTPLEQWPEMNRSLVATLKAQGVYTVDALALLPDGKLNIVGPDGRTWREKAKAHIETAKDGAYATGLAAQVEQLQTGLAAGLDRERALAARVQELETANASGAKPAKPKPEKTAADAIAEVAAAQAAPVVAQPVVVPASGAPVAVAAEGETLVTATPAVDNPII